MRRRISRSHRLEQRRWQRIQSFLLLLVGFILGGLIYGFVFVSPFFQIEKIVVKGASESLTLPIKRYLYSRTEDFVPSFLFYLFPELQQYHMNGLVLHSSHLEATLLKQHPGISSINSHLDFSNHSLTLAFSERKAVFLWCPREEQCYLMDKNGIIFQESFPETDSLLRKIIDERRQKAFLGGNVVAAAQLKILNQAFNLSQMKDSPLHPDALVIKNDNFSFLQLRDKEGWFLSFRIQDDFATVLNIVKRLKEEQLSGKMERLEYIDCRYLPKVYYRFRS